MSTEKQAETPDTPVTDTPQKPTTKTSAKKSAKKTSAKELEQATVQVTEEYILWSGAHTLSIDAANVEICNSRVPSMHLVTTVVWDKSEVTIYNLSQTIIVLTEWQTIAQIR